MLTIDQRLTNLEVSITSASEKLYQVADDAEIDAVMKELRDKLTELYERTRHLKATALSAYEVLKIAEGQ